MHSTVSNTFSINFIGKNGAFFMLWNSVLNQTDVNLLGPVTHSDSPIT